jgi:hypothetical protein
MQITPRRNAKSLENERIFWILRFGIWILKKEKQINVSPFLRGASKNRPDSLYAVSGIKIKPYDPIF